MRAESHIAKWGTSLAVRIPKAIAEQWGVHEGVAIEIFSRGDQVMMRKGSDRTYSLDEMLAQITADNLHPESDTGPVRANEEY